MLTYTCLYNKVTCWPSKVPHYLTIGDAAAAPQVAAAPHLWRDTFFQLPGETAARFKCFTITHHKACITLTKLDMVVMKY